MGIITAILGAHCYIVLLLFSLRFSLLITKICQTHTLLQSEGSSGFRNIPYPKWKRDWQGVRLTKHSWTISSSPSEMAKIFYPSSTLNPTKLRRLQVILYGAINDSTLLAKTFGTTNQIFMSAQLFHIEHTAATPRYEKNKFHFNFNMLVGALTRP